MTRIPLTIDRLPLFADDEQIGEAVLGSERKREFRGFATLLEPKGMPKVSSLFGGRYVPAVKLFLDRYCGVAASGPKAESGTEDLSQWHKRRDRKVQA